MIKNNFKRMISMARTKEQMTGRKMARKSQPATGGIKVPPGKATCTYCEKGPLLVAHHLKKGCIIKKMFGLTAKDIREVLNNQVIEVVELCKRKMEELNIDIQELNIDIQELCSKVAGLEEVIFKLTEERNALNVLLKKDQCSKANENIFGIIKHLPLRKETIKQYEHTWLQYDTWCQKNGKNVLTVPSADDYISCLININPTSTIRKQRNQLQRVLRKVTSSNILLERIHVPLTTKHKEHLTENELEMYLADEKMQNYDLYVPQFIQGKLGLRINAVANLKLEHLLFMSSGDKIIVPDSKTREYTKVVDITVENELKGYILLKKITDQDEYLFPCGTTTNHMSRSKYLSKQINGQMRISEVLKGFKKSLTTHALRRSYANHIFEKENMRLSAMRITSINLGHDGITNTRRYYIDYKN